MKRGSVIAEMASCMGKSRFVSFTIARDRAERRSGLRPRVAYRCRFCGFIHLGERDVARERAQRRIRQEVLNELETDDAFD